MRIKVLSLATCLLLGAAAALTFPRFDALAQEPKVADADVSVWITDIWEHKVTLMISWAFSKHCDMASAGSFSRDCFIGRKFTENNLSEITAARIYDEANTACDFYERTAAGPLNISRPETHTGTTSAYRFEYMYACAIR